MSAIPSVIPGSRASVGRVLLPAGVVVVIAAVYAAALRDGSSMAVFWVIGLGFGFVVQRSRFCFTAAFRDLFLVRQGRTMKGVIVGLVVATLGFAVVMGTIVPNAALGAIPVDAHVLPLGPATVLGGLLFGFGMVIAGGCVSGSLYRMGEGYVASWVAIGGVMVGLYALNRTWNWWWDNSISNDSLVWLPASLGYTGAILLTLAVLAAAYVAILWWERTAGMPFIPTIRRRDDAPPASVRDDVRAILRRIFRSEWSAVAGGAALGALNIALFFRYRPLGVVGEISRWSTDIAESVGAGPGVLRGLENLAGCTAQTVSGGPWFTEGFMLNVGIIGGSFAAATIAGEFRLRIPRQPVRYVQAAAGGVLMGYGAGLAIGCTIGAFFSAIPSLALNGWVFAASLSVGAYLGVFAIRRLP